MSCFYLSDLRDEMIVFVIEVRGSGFTGCHESRVSLAPLGIRKVAYVFLTS